MLYSMNTSCFRAGFAKVKERLHNPDLLHVPVLKSLCKSGIDF